MVTAASVHDKHGPDPLLARAHAAGWRLRRLTGDGSYAGEDVAGDAARHGAILTVAARPRERQGFVPILLSLARRAGLRHPDDPQQAITSATGSSCRRGPRR